MASFSLIGPSPGRSPNLTKVDPRLLEIVSAGASMLPSGYRVTVNEGYNAYGHVANSQHHIAGKGALDVQIVGPDGKVIANEGSDPTGMYQRLAQGAYGYMLDNHPELKGQFAWGGSFDTGHNPLLGKGGIRDLMHFDIGGERGNLFPTLSKLGRLGAATGIQAPSADISNPNSTTLRKGMSDRSTGGAVSALQRQLAAAGFSPGKADGIYGARTAAAVTALQKSFGLQPDGVAGPRTAAALNNVDVTTLTAPGGAPSVAPVSPTDYGFGRQPAEPAAARPAPSGPPPNMLSPYYSDFGMAGLPPPQPLPAAPAAVAAAPPAPTFPAMFDRQTQTVQGAPAGVPGGSPAGMASAIQAPTGGLPSPLYPGFRIGSMGQAFSPGGPPPPSAQPPAVAPVPQSLMSSTGLDQQRMPLQTYAAGGVPFGQPIGAQGLIGGDASARGGAAMAADAGRRNPADMASNAGSFGGPGGSPLDLESIAQLQNWSAPHPFFPASRLADDRTFTFPAAQDNRAIEKALAARDVSNVRLAGDASAGAGAPPQEFNPPQPGSIADWYNNASWANLTKNLGFDALDSWLKGGQGSAIAAPSKALGPQSYLDPRAVGQVAYAPGNELSRPRSMGIGMSYEPLSGAEYQDYGNLNSPPGAMPAPGPARLQVASNDPNFLPGGPPSQFTPTIASHAPASWMSQPGGPVPNVSGNGITPTIALHSAMPSFDDPGYGMGNGADIQPAGGAPGITAGNAIPGVVWGGGVPPGGVPAPPVSPVASGGAGYVRTNVPRTGMSGGQMGNVGRNQFVSANPITNAIASWMAGAINQGRSISYPGASYPGSSAYGSSYGQSAFNPGSSYGFHAPNFDPTSGGAIYAYHPNGDGTGTYINSAGQTLSY